MAEDPVLSSSETPPALRVLVVDDNADVRKAVRFLLDRTPGITCVGAFASTKDLAADIPRLKADVLLIDYSIPGESTLDAVRAAKRDHPPLVCILFSGYDDPEIAAAAFEAGVARCLPKDIDTAALLDAVHSARSVARA